MLYFADEFKGFRVAINVATLNLAGSLSTETNVKPFVDYIKTLNLDAAGFPEAYNVGQEGPLEEATVLLGALGYQVRHVPYNDADERTDKRGIMAISRLGNVQEVRLATRNALRVQVKDQDTNIDIAGLHGHLDDRSEPNRIVQAMAGVEIMPPFMPRYIGLDANNMHREAPIAKLFRFIMPLTYLYPAAEPRIGQNERSLGVIISKARRGSHMARGGAIRVFEDAKYMDVADQEYKPTARFLGGKAAAQLDYVFASPELHAIRHEVIFVDPEHGVRSEHGMVHAGLIRTTLEL